MREKRSHDRYEHRERHGRGDDSERRDRDENRRVEYERKGKGRFKYKEASKFERVAEERNDKVEEETVQKPP